MKIYLAGPMRGHPRHNFPAFHAAAKVLRDAGHEVISPAEMDEQEFLTAEEIDKEAARPDANAFFMRRDLPALLGCGAVVLLPGWEKSQGALTEGIVAAMCKIPLSEYVGSGKGGPEVSIYRMLLALGEKITGGGK